VVFVERAFLGIHVRVLRPRFWNQHRHGVRQAAARQHQQFQRVIECSRIAAARLNNGKQLLDIVAEQR
jgi:hypothetical protein